MTIVGVRFNPYTVVIDTGMCLVTGHGRSYKHLSSIIILTDKVQLNGCSAFSLGNLWSWSSGFVYNINHTL